MESRPVFVKYPEIPHLMEVPEILDEDCLEIYEKLDGGNCQVRNYSGRIFTGSRANFLNREEYFRFPWPKTFNKWAKSNHSFYNLPENLIVFGEFMAFHTLRYKPEFTDRFFLTDVYDLSPQRFIPYDVVRSGLEKDLGIEDILFLEALAKGGANMPKIKELVMGESQYSDYGREGVVIKDYHHQNFAKLWRTSVNRTKEGLIEEINKTILSLQNTTPPIVTGHLSLMVYEELKRSGRKEISLAEISETIKRVTDKI